MPDGFKQDPFSQFADWFSLAKQAQIKDAEAMVLATSSVAGQPSSRVVLLKQLDGKGFVFFTNYESRKAHDVTQNPLVALLFWWSLIDRQIRIEGTIEKISQEESDHYFSTRTRESQIGSWVSLQSQPVADRKIIEERFKKFENEFAGREVLRPPHWGGYRVIPKRFEFWQGYLHRLHDRITYQLDTNNRWIIERLFP